MYRQEVTAKQLLNGTIPPPEQAQVLYIALDAKFGGSSTMYNDQPMYGDQYEYSNSRAERFAPYQQSYQGTGPRSDSAVDKAPREKNIARAMYDFAGEQKGDLSFERGDIIHIVKRSSSQNDWWTGRIGDREGTVSNNKLILRHLHMCFPHML
jgi:SH3 domain-containing YSC84-like protein 1